MRNATPWIVFMDVHVLKKYLTFRGSKLAEPTEVRVKYWLKSDPDSGDQKYEDLWFHDGLTIGLYRYCLTPPFRFDGVIYVRSSEGIAAQTKAVANAIVHVFLDTLLVNAPLRAIVVPKEIFHQVADDLGDLNFINLSQARAGTILLHLVSEPPAYDRYFCFKKSDDPQ